MEVTLELVFLFNSFISSIESLHDRLIKNESLTKENYSGYGTNLNKYTLVRQYLKVIPPHKTHKKEPITIKINMNTVDKNFPKSKSNV